MRPQIQLLAVEGEHVLRLMKRALSAGDDVRLGGKTRASLSWLCKDDFTSTCNQISWTN